MNGLSFFSCSIGSSLWQPILGFNRADLHTPPLFSILALQNGLEDRNADARKILNGRNLVRFRPVTREFTRLNVYSMSINLLLELVLLRSLDGGTGLYICETYRTMILAWFAKCKLCELVAAGDLSAVDSYRRYDRGLGPPSQEQQPGTTETLRQRHLPGQMTFMYQYFSKILVAFSVT